MHSLVDLFVRAAHVWLVDVFFKHDFLPLLDARPAAGEARTFFCDDHTGNLRSKCISGFRHGKIQFIILTHSF